MVWDGADRRANNSSGRCLLHDGIVEWIKEERDNRKEERRELTEKLDKLLDRQEDHHEELAKVKHIVSNGLQSETKNTADKVNKLCDHVETICLKNEARFAEIEKFSWFRTWMNDLRDHIFKYIVLACALGGMAYMTIHYGREIITKALK